MNALKVILIVITIGTLHPCETYSQTKKSEAEELPVQYRRGIELQSGYQSYDEKYAGENLEEIKRSLFPLEGTGVWTELNPKVPRVDYIGLHFVDKDTGWAVGASGAIIKTTNGGEDWTIAETPVTNLLLKVHSYNSQIVIATGYDGIILRSTDGGENFAQVTSGVGTGIDLWGVQMVNDTIGWICGLYNTLLKTADGGITWQSVAAGLNQHYWSPSFLNENYGMIACGGGKILKTTDGGVNWAQLQAGDDRTLYTIDIIDSLHIVAAGERRLEIQYEGGKNVYSSDGGATWIMNDDIPTYTDANWIEFVSIDTGFTINVNKGIYKTTNRGQNWAFVGGGGGDWHLDMIENIGYAGGNGLNIYKRIEGSENWRKIFLNVNLSDVFFINEMKGFVISGDLNEGGVYKTETGGINFQKIEDSPRGANLLFLDSLTGFIAGKYKTTDGGETWYTINGGGTKIFFINDSVGWSIDNRILKTTDKGENWAVQQTASNFTSIYFVDEVDGWATGSYIWKTTNGGSIWLQQTNTPVTSLDDVYFFDIDTGWISKYSSFNNSLFKTTNRGLDWLAIPEVVGARKFRNFPDLVHWMIIGFSKYYITNNYGFSWSDITEDIPSGMVNFYALTNKIGYAVGSTGLIIKYLDTTYIPVELLLFSGRFENKIFFLSWVTASELNNYGFVIEHSSNNFDWHEIGFVPGKGTSTEINQYYFKDYNIKYGKQFYRLKQIDYDGIYSYSNVIEIISDIENKSFQFYNGYPNPFNSSTIISYHVANQSLVNISLFNLLGEKVIEIINEEKPAGYHREIFPSASLPSGIYFIKMTTNSGFNAVNKITIIK